MGNKSRFRGNLSKAKRRWQPNTVGAGLPGARSPGWAGLRPPADRHVVGVVWASPELGTARRNPKRDGHHGLLEAA